MVAQTNFKHIGLLVYGRFPTEKAYGGMFLKLQNPSQSLVSKQQFFSQKLIIKKASMRIPKNIMELIQK